ncbi:hypothetical protein IQ238_16860 [Pleurocapsales cyanobacterium LEGE 06147]|nr:hypothetical protein [Pleurocapsales cyanobacterium LEGE 06147]
MTTQEDARKKMAESRQQGEHLKESMLNRSEEKLNRPESSDIDEEARELMVEQRHHDKQLKKTMLSRSEEEIGIGESNQEQDSDRMR